MSIFIFYSRNAVCIRLHALGHVLGRWHTHIPCKAKKFEHTNTEVNDIYLPPKQPVPRGRREGVMIVVPAFDKGRDRTNEIVFAFIMGIKWRSAEQVAEGIDAPGAMMDQKHANEAAP